VQGDAVREDQHRLRRPLLPHTRETSAKVSESLQLFTVPGQLAKSVQNVFRDSHMQGSFCGHACAMHYLPVLLSNRFDISGYSSKSTTYPVFSYKNGIWDLEQMYFNHVGTQSLVTKMGFLISNRCIFKQGT